MKNRPCYNNLFQFMQRDNFRNLNKVILTHWKQLQSRVNAFWYWFSVIKLYIFHYFMKSAPIPRNQNSFEILHLFETWCYQSFPIGKKTTTRCLFKTSKTSCQDILQTSKRCLKRKSERHLRKTSWRDLCKIYFRCLTEDVLKMSY